MRGILRLGLMMLLVAAAGVGNVWGKWETWGTWQYDQIDETTCRIRIPESDRESIRGSVTIPSEVEDGGLSLKVVEIAKEAFSGCSKLEVVDIPNSVTTIGKRAFKFCVNLTKVNIPNGVTEIAAEAFYFCKSLATVDIPNSVKTIGKFAFSGCKELKEVTIPSSVKTIGDGAFSSCDQLTAFKVDEKNASYSQDGGVLFTKDRDTLVSYPGGRKGAYEIPGSVTGIDSGAFRGCPGLTAVEIPSSVGWIGPNAFAYCKSLNTVYVYRPVDQEFTVDEKAFEGIGGNSATLYVRLGMKKQIKGEPWCATDNFTNIVEFCVVSFGAQQGVTTPDAQMVVKDGKATEPKAPTREGYTFVEWQLDGVKYDFRTPVTEDIELVAVWKQNYMVTFDAKGGTPAPGVQTVVEDGTATAPTAPTREGYTFVEWQLDGKKYDFSTPVTKDITLVAMWKEKEESTPDNPETAVESVQLAAVRVVRNPMGEALELEGMERAARVEVYSVAGARVCAEALRGEPRVVIDAQGWANGVYVVRVEASDGAKTLRVVK